MRKEREEKKDEYDEEITLRGEGMARTGEEISRIQALMNGQEKSR